MHKGFGKFSSESFYVANAPLFKKIIYFAWALFISYTCLYYYLDYKLSLYAISIATFVTTPSILFLENRGLHSTARILFLISGNFYIYITSLNMKHLIQAEYYYLPAMMIPLILFNYSRKLLITFSALLPLCCWLVTRVYGYSFLSENWLIHDMPLRLIQDINFLGGFALTFVVLGVCLQALNKQMVQISDSETRKRAMINSAIDGIITIDQNQRVIEFNPSAEKIFGYSFAEAHEKQIVELIIPESMKLKRKEEFMLLMMRTNDSESLNKKIEIPVTRKDGAPLMIEMYIVQSKAENKLFFTLFIRDITLLKHQKDIIEMQRAQMVASSKLSALGEMAAGIAHEINNPLTIIAGRLSIIKKQLKIGSFTGEQFLEAILKIEKMTNRISKIIRGLRSISRNANEDPFETGELCEIWEDTLELCSEKLKRKAIELQIKPCDKVNITCRPTQISQVLMNLISNSVDAIELLPEKWIRIEFVVKGAVLQIVFTDSGNGIPESVARKIMDPFFTTKEAGKGTGLGLSISKGIIEEHGGRLWYDSSSTNTCFRIELPLAESQINHVPLKQAS